MFLTLKKYDIISCVMAVFIAFVTFGYIKNGTDAVVTNAITSNRKVIVIDAGHGIPDSGAVGKNGTLEANINLDIAKRLQKNFEESGAYVLMTRTDDNSVAPDLNEKIRDIKRKDLNYRKNFKEDAQCDIFLSIHMNKFPEEKYYGAQVFYSKSPDNSKILGECIQERLKTEIQNANNRVAKESNNDIFILKGATVPSVIVECGFLSNENEEKLLNTDEYRDKVAMAIFMGVTDYFEKIK